jgi:hypothetical protein
MAVKRPAARKATALAISVIRMVREMRERAQANSLIDDNPLSRCMNPLKLGNELVVGFNR